MIAVYIALTFFCVVIAVPVRHDVMTRDIWSHLKHGVEKAAHHVGHALEDGAIAALINAARDRIITGKRDATTPGDVICSRLKHAILLPFSSANLDQNLLMNFMKQCGVWTDMADQAIFSNIERHNDQALVEHRRVTTKRGFWGDLKQEALNLALVEGHAVEALFGAFVGSLETTDSKTIMSELKTLRERFVQWLAEQARQKLAEQDKQDAGTETNRN